MIRPIVFCKAPVPGKVKTRLHTKYSLEQATQIHIAMATQVLNRSARLYPHTWIAADDPDHPFFQSFDLPVLAQGDGDLGARMARVSLRAITQGARGVLLLGTDSPHMSEYRLHAAMKQLTHHDVVIGAVEDGGYDLLAMNGMHDVLFQNVPWGSPEVLNITLAHIITAGLSYTLLDTGFDVDTPEDLTRAMRAGFSFKSHFPNLHDS